MTASRPRRHAARVVAASALVLTVAALSACSAGQITQTSSQVAAVPGANVDAKVSEGGPATVALRDITIVYKDTAGYPAGAAAPLVVRLFNLTPLPIQLTRVDAGEHGSVVLTGGADAETPASPTPEATASPAAGEDTFSVTIPGAGYTLLVPGEGPYLQIADLTNKLAPGDQVEVTFVFSDGSSARTNVTIAPPTAPAPRSPMHLEEEEGAGHA